MHCNLRPPEPRQSFTALITIYDAMPTAKFEVAETSEVAESAEALSPH